MKEQIITDAKLHTKCGWSPYSGLKIKGWPKYTILRGQVFDVSE